MLKHIPEGFHMLLHFSILNFFPVFLLKFYYFCTNDQIHENEIVLNIKNCGVCDEYFNSETLLDDYEVNATIFMLKFKRI